MFPMVDVGIGGNERCDAPITWIQGYCSLRAYFQPTIQVWPPAKEDDAAY
tara:strand:+ start:215 stop:364 length:150 start_codon:yes stop_codon:yes gene_type:complete